MKALKPEVMLGDSCRRFHEQGLEEARESTQAAISMVKTFVESDAHLLVLQSTSQLINSVEWTSDLLPLLTREGCSWTSTGLSAIQVGLPSTKRRTYIVCVRGVTKPEEKLLRWTKTLNSLPSRSQTLGEFLGRGGGLYFLRREHGTKCIFSMEDPVPTLKRTLIFGEKPSIVEYVPHPSDAGPLREAQELHFSDFAKIATGEEEFIIPPTVSSSAAANILVDAVPTSMFRTVLASLKTSGLLVKETPLPRDSEPEGLECAASQGCCAISHVEREHHSQRMSEYSPADGSTTSRPEVIRKGRRGWLRSQRGR